MKRKMMKKIINKDLHTYLKVIGIIFLATLIFGYALFQARNIILGPVIEIRSPQNGASLDNSLVEIKGKAKNISRISMNGNQIFTDNEGMFSEKLLLSYGYNIITIKVQDRFNRELERKLELIYK
jgi:capsule polysaccharide export protein KpsE/RkpR